MRLNSHNGPVQGVVCRECVLTEIEEVIAEEHSELDRGVVLALLYNGLSS